MTKSELVDKIAAKAALTKAAAEKALNAFTSSVTDALKKGGKVTLVGFGTFSTTKRAKKGKESSDRERDQDKGIHCSQVQGRKVFEGLCK